METLIKRCTYLFALSVGLLGCSSNLDVAPTQPSVGLFSATPHASAFEPIYNEWKGTPYRLGGNDHYGIDCSAFVQIAYQEALAINLPRTTLLQSKLGSEISYSNAQSGDLVFFKTGYKVRHVGVYLGNNAFMHASTSKGVMISRLDNPYWADAFWHFRRVGY